MADLTTLAWATIYTAGTSNIRPGIPFTLADPVTLATVLSGVTDSNGQIAGDLPGPSYRLTVAGITKTVDVPGAGEVTQAELNLVESGRGARTWATATAYPQWTILTDGTLTYRVLVAGYTSGASVAADVTAGNLGQLPGGGAGSAADSGRLDVVEVALGGLPASAIAQPLLGLTAVATRGDAGLFSLSDGVATTHTTHTRHKLIPTTDRIRIWWTNLGPDPLTLKASVALSTAGTRIPVYFAGSRTVTVAAGAGILSDELAIYGVAGQLIDVWTGGTVAATKKWQGQGPTLFTAAGGEGVATSDMVDAGTVANSFGFGVMPSAIVGAARSKQKSVALVGDSILQGSQDSVQPVEAGSHAGYLGRAYFAAGVPFVMCAQSGSSASDFLAELARLLALTACSHATCEYGSNDIVFGASLATVQSRLLSIWTLLWERGLKVTQTTILGRPAFTAAQKTIRADLNAWIRAGAPISRTTKAAAAVGTAGALLARQVGHPLDGFHAVSDLGETVRDSNVWKTFAVGTGSTTSGSTAVTGVATTSGAFAVGQQIDGPGIPVGTTIAAVPSATTVTLSLAATATGAGVALTCSYSSDGDHPNSQGAIAISAGVDVATQLAIPAVPSAFMPTSLFPAVWWDAAQEVNFVDGAAVDRFTDRSGNARHALQATAANQPLLKTYALNGLPVLRFDGVNDSMGLAALDLSGTAQLTVFAVAKLSAAALMSLIESSTDSFTINGTFNLLFSAAAAFQPLVGGGGTGNYFTSTPTYNGVAAVFEGVFDRSLSTREAQALVNGVRPAGVQSSDFNSAGNFTSQPVYLGARAGTSRFLNGDIGEVLIFDKLLAAVDHQNVIKYLRDKWGT